VNDRLTPARDGNSVLDRELVLELELELELELDDVNVD